MTLRTGRARYFVRLLAVGLFAVATLSSCQVIGLLFGVTIDQRIKDFSNGYTSGDYTDLYKNFSTSTQMYDQIKAASYWTTTPFASNYQPQPITSYNISGSTVTGTFTNNTGTTFDFTIQMQEQGIDWYILSLSMVPATSPSSTPNPDIKRIY